MTAQQVGKIASRSIALLLIVVGAVMLLDYYFAFLQAQSFVEGSGWSDYDSVAEVTGEVVEGSQSLAMYDAYYITGSLGSTMSSILFIGIGAVFLFFSGLIGRLIAGRSDNEE